MSDEGQFIRGARAGFILRAAARATWIAGVDAVTVGLAHPGLLAWRVELAAASVMGAGRGRRFGALVQARRDGNAQMSFTQGDTPWEVLRRVVPWLQLGPGDVFVDVGAGNGLAAAVIALLSGAEGIAVEPVDALRDSAMRGLGALRVRVTTESALGAVELGRVRGAYLNWTCVDAPTREGMRAELGRMPVGARAATTTDPLEGPGWRTVHSEGALFPWGRDRWFISERR